MINKITKLRLSLLAALFLLFFSIIVINLYCIQIIKHHFFSSLAQQQYTVIVKTLPARASLFDSKNNIIATEKSITSIFITPNNLKNKNALLLFLSEHYPQAIEKLNCHAQSHFMYVARNISDAEITALATHAPEDIFLLDEPGRWYPVGCLGPVVGKTDIDNKGISGIELLYNEHLAGTPTTASIEKDARSGRFYFNKKTLTTGHEGQPLHLTLDSTLQFLAYEELKETIKKFNAKEGAVVIMDPFTGALSAMVTYPCADPNCPHLDDVSLLKNKVVTETYELGSVMKTFLALAALEEKLYLPEDTIDCENSKIGYVNGMKFSTWKEHGHLTLSEIIEFSNNIGTAKIAQKLGTLLYDHYQKCGFGKPTGLTFPGQQKGHVTHPKTWSKASLNSLSFGYEIRATLLQLARAFSIFANGGYLPTPNLVSDTAYKSQQPSLLYRPETIHHMRSILEKTCTQGTAHAAKIPGVTVLGKTGTARLIDETGTYSPLKNIYTFAGIVEKGSYKRVIVTFVKEAERHDLYASSVAAPLFERIAQKMLIHDKVI